MNAFVDWKPTLAVIFGSTILGIIFASIAIPITGQLNEYLDFCNKSCQNTTGLQNISADSIPCDIEPCGQHWPDCQCINGSWPGMNAT